MTGDVASRVVADAWEAVAPRLLQPGLRLEERDGALVGSVEGVRLGRPLGRDGPDPRPAYGRELDGETPLPPAAFVVGSQPWWDAARWPASRAAHASLRAQLRRATRHGVTVERLSDPDVGRGSPLRAALEELVGRWQHTRFLPPLGFAAAVRPFDPLTGRSWWVARRDGHPCALAVVTPIPARRAWVVDHLVRARGAPNGTMDLLVDAVLSAAAPSGVDWVTLGPCPLAGPVSAPLRWVRRAARGLYDFEGLAAFKARFRPDRWDRVLVEHPGVPAAWGLYRVLRAFAGGGLLRFGVATALRGPPALLWALAVALPPWALVLAAAPDRWYPTAAVRWAWVGYDLLFAAALLSLARRVSAHAPRDALHAALAIAASLDASLTAIQALTWNLPRSGPADLPVLALAVAAPAAAAAVLWSGRGHREPPAVGASG